MSLSETLSNVINMEIISAITSTLFIILLGYFLRKREVFSSDVGKTLSKVVLTVAIPALAFNSFMQDLNDEVLNQGINILILGILVHVFLIFLSKFFFFRYAPNKEDTLRVLSIFGSTTFFGIPVVGAVFGAEGILYASIFNIGYRIFLYSYAYLKMSGLKMARKNIREMILNPIVLATFIGLFIWLFQDSLPQIAQSSSESVAFLRIDQTLPWLFKPLTFLSSLASPLAWLAIGITLGDLPFGKTLSSQTSWYYSFIKVVVFPLVILLSLLLLNAMNILPVNSVGLSTMIIMMATPAATVAVAYAINFEKEAVLASNASLLSTLFSIVLIPIWIIVLNLIGN
ncbi:MULTISPECIES: AEC family transporter [Enterococcus]|uniref:Malate permease n=1 Tax=Candidatus Enterococcus mangumiae TaxID=2230878 RepID=A0ABZ2SVH4_9ENTE|nr:MULTISPECIES: AEC family transporter [unclassified Enterococcus]MBO0460207.1 AEC family transporter [Enterococcus sp. DIV1298c]MBO0490094.1 AEC family transporter [Enterococcus sp. DIV1094]MBO1299696.1 AEC family transporter [Enterococcus sp. DIV1271a]